MVVEILDDYTGNLIMELLDMRLNVESRDQKKDAIFILTIIM